MALVLEVTTLALLSLSPLVRLSRANFFALALMLLIFAPGALFGLGYPASPQPLALNAASRARAEARRPAPPRCLLTVAAGYGRKIAAAPAAVLGPRAALRSASGLPSQQRAF